MPFSTWAKWSAWQDLNLQNVLPLKQADMPFSYTRIVKELDGSPGEIRTHNDAGFKPAAYAILLQGYGGGRGTRTPSSLSGSDSFRDCFACL